MVNDYPSMNGGASNRQRTNLAPVAVTDSWSLNLQTASATVEATNNTQCHRIQLRDGDGYRLVSRVQHLMGKERACTQA